MGIVQFGQFGPEITGSEAELLSWNYHGVSA